MLLFSRIVTLTGSPRQTVPWAAEITAYVNAHSPLQVACWSGDFGYPLGTVAWSSLVESQAGLAAGSAELLADGAYFDLVESGAALVHAPGQDTLRQIVHGAPTEPPPLGAVAVITTATAVVDRYADAIGWGVEIAQHGEQVTGAPISVLTDLYGAMGAMAWISVQPDMASAEAAGMALRGDAGYIGRLTGSKGLFIPGSGHVSRATRIA